ncbi:MAG TPA: hypothetical protein VN661_10970 [Candidatus Acidoferrales bacterium]|nr:hypothetical protein [Candidatus Acidoferrales bacterium]
MPKDCGTEEKKKIFVGRTVAWQHGACSHPGWSGCTMKAYLVGCWITFVVLFLGFWIYCIGEYGFLIGVGAGWIPSGIAAGC